MCGNSWCSVMEHTCRIEVFTMTPWIPAAYKSLASWGCVSGFILCPVVPFNRCAEGCLCTNISWFEKFTFSTVPAFLDPSKLCSLLLPLLFFGTTFVAYFHTNLANIYTRLLLALESETNFFCHEGPHFWHITEVCVDDTWQWNEISPDPGPEVLSAIMSHPEDESLVSLKENSSWTPFARSLFDLITREIKVGVHFLIHPPPW